MIPGIKGLKPMDLQMGEDWFSEQNEGIQRKMFSNNKLYEEWEKGNVQFNQLSHEHDDPIYGMMKSQTSYKSIFGDTIR